MDFIEKAILIGIGLEKKLKEVVCELEQRGKEGGTRSESGSGGPTELPPKKRLENRVVEDATKAIKEILSILKEGVKEGKDKIEGNVGTVASTLAERCGLAAKDEVEVIREMARIAREKADKLEKRLEEIEKALKKKT